MFGIDTAKMIEHFLESAASDRIIADVIGKKIKLKTHRNGNKISFEMFYGGHKVTESSIDISPEE